MAQKLPNILIEGNFCLKSSQKEIMKVLWYIFSKIYVEIWELLIGIEARTCWEKNLYFLYNFFRNIFLLTCKMSCQKYYKNQPWFFSGTSQMRH